MSIVFKYYKFDLVFFDMIITTMSNESTAQIILYELWFSVAETIFQRVCEITELTEEQREALKSVALRPNDFQVRIDP